MGKWQRFYLIAMGLHLVYFLYGAFPWFVMPIHFGFRLDWSSINGEGAVACGFAIWVVATAGRLWEERTLPGSRLRHGLLLLLSLYGAVALVIPPLRDSLWFTFGPVIFLAWYLSVLDVILVERKRRRFPHVGLGLLALVITLHLLLFVPSGLYYRYPNSFVDMNRIVQVEGGKPQGRILGLTVSTEPAPLLPYLIAQFRPEIALLSPGPDVASPEREQRLVLLRQSGDVRASAVAQQHLGIAHAPVREVGILVTMVAAKSPADGQIQLGDVILAIGEESVTSTEQFRQRLAQYRPGQSVPLALRRKDGERQVSITLASRPENAEAAYMGVGTEDQWRFDVPIPVTVIDDDVAGDSWTGVLALAVIDQLTPGGITNGNLVAGTGSIGADGSINPIGGLPQKVYLAERAGADVIFVPAAQLGEVPPGLRGSTIVGVTHLREMLTWLEQHPKAASSR